MGKGLYYNIGQYAYQKHNYFAKQKDSLTYVEKIAQQTNLEIKKVNIKGIDDMSSCVIEKYSFSKMLSSKPRNIYTIYPIITRLIANNIFNNIKRELPFEFNYPYEYALLCYITIPETFEVESLTEPSKVELDDHSCSCTYNIKQIVLKYTFKLNRTLFDKMKYQSLRSIWDAIIAKNNELITIKKKRNI